MSNPSSMDTVKGASRVITQELASDDAEVRAEFLKRYPEQIAAFARDMGAAFVNWRSLDAMTNDDAGRAHVVGVAYTSMTLHVASMKLLLCGQAVAAGNLYRQVVEAMALALLCSVGKRLKVLEAFMQDRYSSSDAIRDMLRNAEMLGLNEAASVFKEVQQFNHKYSHPSAMTIGHAMALDSGGALYVCAAFDPNKLEYYSKEVASRCSCASVFSNFIDGVKANLGKWRKQPTRAER